MEVLSSSRSLFHISAGEETHRSPMFLFDYHLFSARLAMKLWIFWIHDSENASRDGHDGVCECHSSKSCRGLQNLDVRMRREGLEMCLEAARRRNDPKLGSASRGCRLFNGARPKTFCGMVTADQKDPLRHPHIPKHHLAKKFTTFPNDCQIYGPLADSLSFEEDCGVLNTSSTAFLR